MKTKKGLKEMISEYNTLPKTVGKEEKDRLYTSILSQLRETIYFLPQKYFRMDEEDCADFLLFMEESIDSIIANYNDNYSNFESYIYPILDRRIKTFRKNKIKKEKRENSLLYGYSAYEFELNEENNSIEEFVASEQSQTYRKENIVADRLRFVFWKNKKAKERFYIYFLSHAVAMTPNLINSYCRFFSFNFQGTMTLITNVYKETEASFSRQNSDIEKRNYYFGKRLFLENELSELNFLEDHSMDEIYSEKINRLRKYELKRGNDAANRDVKLTRSMLAKIFGLTEGTVATALFFSKNIIQWASDPDSIPTNLMKVIGINEKLAEQAKQRDWPADFFDRLEGTDIFNPIEHFGLKFIEQIDQMKYPLYMDILLASSNKHKLHEFEQLFAPHVLHLPEEFGITFECEEDGKTFYENALKKAEALYAAASHLGMPILADDSGLTVDALPGELGIHTARYGSKPGEPILPSNEKNKLLLKAMQGIPKEKRTARFTTVLVFKDKDRVISTQGVAEGRIQEEITNGDGGFGYDPVFYCNEAGTSMALLPEGGKNKYSHRGKAARELLKIIDRK